MTVPRSALLLGLAGLIPFIWGVITLAVPPAGQFSIRWFGLLSIGPYVQVTYGTVILAFMSGVLWGFATKAEGPSATAGYALSVLPALWAFFTTQGHPTDSMFNLIVGFIALLGLDYLFWKNGFAPEWWMQLRLLLTAVVVGCLGLSLVLVP